MGMTNQGGKGSGVRPLSVSRQQFNNNFDDIFGKKKEPEPAVPDIGVKATDVHSGMGSVVSPISTDDKVK